MLCHPQCVFSMILPSRILRIIAGSRSSYFFRFVSKMIRYPFSTYKKNTKLTCRWWKQKGEFELYRGDIEQAQEELSYLTADRLDNFRQSADPDPDADYEPQEVTQPMSMSPECWFWTWITLFHCPYLTLISWKFQKSKFNTVWNFLLYNQRCQNTMSIQYASHYHWSW